jgi:hypothetical protein
VDFIINLTKPGGQPPEVRELEAVGRFEMPERIQIRRRANFQLHQSIEIESVNKLSARYVFEAVSTQNDSAKARIRAVLGRGAQTAKQLSTELELSVTTVTRVLEDMAGDVIQVGKGGPRNNAALYGLKNKTSSSPLKSLKSGEVESSALRPTA